jgi:F-type H+-transporting ATPase subunit b
MFWMTPEFWLAVSFAIFLALLYRKIVGGFLGMVDGRAERIRSEMDEARQLREDAETMLASYKARQQQAATEAQEIVTHARDQAIALRQRAAAELEEALRRREKQALDSIAQMEKAAVAEVRNITVDLAVSITSRVLTARIDRDVHGRLIADSLGALPQLVH